MTNAQFINLAITDSDSTHTDFSPAVSLVTIKNIGTNSCYFNLNATATTSHFLLLPGDEIKIGLSDIDDVHAICDSTKTTTLSIIGVASW